MKKGHPRSRTDSPIAWIESSTPEEIGEALLAVDEAKAAAVVLHIARRTGPELKRMLDSTGQALERDPLSTIMTMVISGIKGTS